MASAAMRGDGGLARNGRRWLVGVRDKLSRHDGLQLVKILYYRDPGISGRDLDGADSVFHIYSLSKDSLGGDGEAAVALLYYRLSLLVLQRSVEGANGLDTGLDPGKLLRAKDLGGQDCLKYYAECGLITPPEPSVQPEARLLECFVTAYVNLSPRKRKQLREILADTVGVYRVKQLDLFNLFCRFLHQSDEESTADKFIITLNNAEVPQQVFDQLQTQLANHNISYHPIAREELKTQAETEEDCLSETEFLPPDIKEKPGVCKRICTIPRVACAFVFIVPLVLFAVAVSVSTSTIKSQAQSQSAVRHYDTSGILFESSLCNTRDRDTPPLIYIGTISNQWTSGFRLTQDVPNKEKYAYKNLNVYTVPSNKVIKYKKLFNCSTANYHSPVELELQGVYFLRGTNMTFKVCILSKQDEDGWVGLAFYDTYENYLLRFSACRSGNHSLNYHRFTVPANGAACYTYNYTVPVDAFYYIMMGTHCQSSSDNVYATNYELKADMRYVNSSDWLNVTEKSACNCSETSSEKECTFTLPKKTTSFLSPQTYDIFVQVTSTEKKNYPGHLSIQPLLDKKESSSVIPTVGGLIFLVLVEVVLCIVCVVVCYCVRRSKGRTQNVRYVEIENIQ